MQKYPLVTIVGPTATGKTQLGMQLARRFSGELISADSRQVYVGMDIGTGKDIPIDSEKSSIKLKSKNKFWVYKFSDVNIWGYDFVKPDQSFSVGQYSNLTHEILSDVWQRSHLPIVVGGTGLYVRSLLEPDERLGVPPNENLRTTLSKLSVDKLQKELKKHDFDHFSQLNYSDVNNPRRLIRAIELVKQKPKKITSQPEPKNKSVLSIGLSGSLDVLDKRINQRVIDRVEKGMTSEVESLIKSYPDFDLQAWTATGYREWRLFLEGDLTKDQAIKQWQLRERQYARRQLTWFKKQSKIAWLDMTDSQLEKKAADLLSSCFR